ncbi:MAG TPA: methyltransferase domain-containing protein [Verrucomicrobiae bacterium]|nr:methyltransferase domain-containing protein [Verrucomicrobiae bacterium]
MSYTAFDRFVAWRRFRAALPYIRKGARVCDIGCGLDARFLQWLGPRIGVRIGLDCQVGTSTNNAPVVVSDITKRLPVKSAQFDHTVMLAVLEHLAQPEDVLREAHRVLVPGGSLIMTWPNAAVDPILGVLHRVGVVSDEMESEKHQRRIPLDELQAMLSEVGFERFMHHTFEFGLNNLMIAHKKAT